MKKYFFALAIIIVFSVPSYALFGPKGDTVKKKQDVVRKDRDKILAEICKAKPDIKISC